MAIEIDKGAGNSMGTDTTAAPDTNPGQANSPTTSIDFREAFHIENATQGATNDSRVGSVTVIGGGRTEIYSSEAVELPDPDGSAPFALSEAPTPGSISYTATVDDSIATQQEVTATFSRFQSSEPDQEVVAASEDQQPSQRRAAVGPSLVLTV